MQTTLTRFKDQYFNYKVTKGKDNDKQNFYDNGLAVGLFKFAFCADMCTTYIFEKKERCFWHAKYNGIYCNDGLMIFLGKLTQNELPLWLKSFQKKVDTLVGGTFFHFTAEIWTPDKEIEEINDGLVKQQWLDKAKVINDHVFPFLDMQMEWKDDILTFSIYAKPNHTITSCHCPAVFKAIPVGVFTRLGRLTSIIMENIKPPITKLYPAHTSALQNDGMLPNKFLP
eukprot:1894633-Ditylum_brightwellii.AAC.1